MLMDRISSVGAAVVNVTLIPGKISPFAPLNSDEITSLYFSPPVSSFVGAAENVLSLSVKVMETGTTAPDNSVIS